MKNQHSVNELTDTHDVRLNDSEWLLIKDLCYTFETINVLVKNTQSPQMTPGTFYLNWLDTIRRFKKINSMFSKKMVECLEKRQKGLLNKDVYLCSLFLDPRTKPLLDNSQTGKAISYLKKFLKST